MRGAAHLKRTMRRLGPQIDRINIMEADIRKLSDHQLRARINE